MIMARKATGGRKTPEDRDEDLGYSTEDAPESQGVTADTGFGRDGQGAFGDEDYDPSYGTAPASEPQLDRAEHGADTPSQIDWSDTEGDGSQAVANEEREVATGDLAALEEIPKRTSWSGEEGTSTRSDDAIREEIAEMLSLFEGIDVSADVSDGQVLLSGSVDRPQLREAIDKVVQAVEAVKSIENHIRVQP
jgi:hypothetical protein